MDENITTRIAEISFQKVNDINVSARITLTDELLDIGLDISKDTHIRVSTVKNGKEKKIVIEKIKII